MRRIWMVSVVAVTAILTGSTRASAAAPRVNATASAVEPAAPTVDTVLVKGGLAFPAAFTVDPDGRIFYGERFTGEIRIYDPSNGSDTLFFTIDDIATTGEQGLLGIALHPRYPTRGFVYAYATVIVNGVTKNEIFRITESGGIGTDSTVIYASKRVSSIHNGGRILFGSDSKLYAVVGDAADPANSQNLGNSAGKLLRMTVSGLVPPDNPFPGSRVWVYGVRNSYGFTFDPMTDYLWETENGPACNDELNRMVKAENHGWGPKETCSTPPSPPQNTNQDGPSPVLPQRFYTPTIAPVGVAFCVGCAIDSAEGAFLFGAYNDDKLRQATLDSGRGTIASTSVVYTHSTFILSVERGSDGTMYVSDSTGIWKLVPA